jgi:hypothetical protein
MLKQNNNQKQVCSVEGLLKENDLIRIVVDGLPWKSRVENASRANEGIVQVAAPLVSIWPGQLKAGATVDVLSAEEQALFVMKATVVGKCVDRVNTIVISIDSVEAVQRRIAPRAKVVLPVRVSEVGSTDWEFAKSINIGTGGMLIAAGSCNNIHLAQMLEVTIGPAGSNTIYCIAQVVGREERPKSGIHSQLLRLSFEDIDNNNRLVLYRLVQSCLERA